MGKTNSLTRLNVGDSGASFEPIIQLTNTVSANVNPGANFTIPWNAVAIQNTSPATFTPTVTGVQCNIIGLYLMEFHIPVYNNSGLGIYGDLRISAIRAGVIQALPVSEFHIPGGKNESPDWEGIISVTVAGQILGINTARSAGGGGQALPIVAGEGVLIVSRVQ